MNTLKTTNSLRVAVLAIATTAILTVPATANRGIPEGSRSKRVEQRLEVRGRQVFLEANSAQVVARPTDGDSLVMIADLEFWSSDEEWMNEVERTFEVTLRESSDRVELGLVRLPEGQEGWFKKIFRSRNVHYSLEIALEVPRGTSLDIENRYGDIDVAGLEGRLAIQNSSGKILASDIKDRAHIENRYGDVVVANVQGDLELTVSSGQVEVNTVTGSAEVENRYGDLSVTDVGAGLNIKSSSGKIEITNIGGPARSIGSYGDTVVRNVEGAVEVEVSSGNVTLRDSGSTADVRASYGAIEIVGVGGRLTVVSSSGSARIEDVQGSVRLENSYGDVELQNIIGDVDVRNPNGGVTLEEITGNASIDTSYAPVRARHLSGSLEVSANSSAVTAEDVGGGLQVTTSYAGVIVRGVGGAIDVRNQSGRVEVSGLTGNALRSQHRVHTSYADVDFDWPTAAAMTYSLESTYGSLSVAFPGSINESGSRKNAEGRVGGDDSASSATVTLAARSGSVHLGKE